MTTSNYGDANPKTMSEDERMTRLAAVALGRKMGNWKWDGAHRGLYMADEQDARKYMSFSPLTDRAHAYEMEDLLEMDIQYVTAASKLGAITSIRITDKLRGGHVFRTPRGDETTLMARMAAATHYAALCAIMEDAEGAEDVLLSAGSRGG